MPSSPLLRILPFLMSVLACTTSTGECPQTGCPSAGGNTRMLSGTITRATGASAPITQTVTTSSDSNAVCTISGLQVQVFRDEFVNGTGPMLSCSGGGVEGGFHQLGLTKLGDPREWTKGVRTLRGDEAGLYLEICEPGAGRGCTLCKAKTDDVTVTVTVEEASGGKAAYPTLVTPDYKRVWRVDLDVATRPTVPVSGGGCPTVSSKVSLRFEQTAADWKYDPHGPCICE